MLVSLSGAFDTNTIDDLLFLASPARSELYVSGDGVLKFSRLIGSGFAAFALHVAKGARGGHFDFSSATSRHI
jgi:hypothetical protein